MSRQFADTMVVNWVATAALVLGIASPPTRIEQVQPAPAAPPPADFRMEPLPKDVGELEKRFTATQIAILEKLNRRDREHLPRVDPPVPGLVVPTSWPEDELAFSPVPADYLWARGLAKSIVVEQEAQVFAAYEFGRLVRWGPVSTGRKETPTPAGMFNLTWKARQRRSTDNDQWLLRWYFNFINSRGVSFHQFDLPGYPASHACVRLLDRDAEWLYRWGDQWSLDAEGRRVLSPGTTVLIIGTPSSPARWTSAERRREPISLPALPLWILLPAVVTHP